MSTQGHIPVVGGAPVFVVVGHVNRGKSSIVSTLAMDESVGIGPEPGTTTHNRAFPMRIGDRTLYTLIDTPGFERARQALAWLRERETGTGGRAQAVASFVEYFAHNPRFRPECELLAPIVKGGAILYVVDGSVPFSPHYEAEMEILRWTGRPRMALVNTIGREDHVEEWRRVLDQYFSLVRVFDAHDARFADALELLKAVRELSEVFRRPVDEAIEALRADRRARHAEAAGDIAEMLAEMLTCVEEQRLPEDAEPEPYKKPLGDQYQARLRRIEQRLRSDLREIYTHRSLRVEESPLDAVSDDLFDTDTWSRVGLTRDQLAAATTFAGALAGGVIDAAVGGASVMLGSLIGGAIGFSTTWLGWRHLEEVKVMGGVRFAGKLLRVGPMRNVRFPWVALDRALIYHALVSGRAHARRSAESLGEYRDGEGIVRHFDATLRGEIERCFARLRKSPADAGPTRGRLAGLLADWMIAHEEGLAG